ncbi:hypothetical protein BGZ70_001053 [Mortierella alpina]|uniref:Beta-lactamase/transpeptidase-like protein n=1 Tax=Mortierella alpina TaxID=64518 RepID=A0A9P6LYC1_MORAP|nr:hypothetical protein BGZ70_001053 [Mortierella alpina]
MKLSLALLLTLQYLSTIQGSQYVFDRTAPLAGLRDVLEEARVQSGIPGMSVAVLHKGKLVFAEGFGKRNELEPFTAETLAPIASLTKAFTAAAIGELVGEGKMDWDSTPVSKYLPEFELQDPVLTSQLTLQDLLSHRTGLPQVDLGWFWNTESRRDLIKRLRHVKMESKLRTAVQYNNVMYGVAGEAAANVAGMSYEELVETKVLKPLGLSSTGFSTKEMRKNPNHALPYEAASFKDAQNGVFKPLPLDNMATACAPSGDIYSNVLDLVHWGQIIMNYGEHNGTQLLNRDSVMEMLSGHTIDFKGRRTPEFGPLRAYGLGWGLDSYKGYIVYKHGGHNPGYVSSLSLFPDAELVIAHLINVDSAALNSNTPLYIADELLNLPRTQDWLGAVNLNETRDTYEEIAQEAQGDFPERIRDKPSMRGPSELAGEYSNPIYGDVSIRLERSDNEKETLHMTMRVFEGTLEHYHYESFYTVLRHSSFKFANLLTFVAGEDGQIVGFQMDISDSMEMFHRKESSV